MLWIRPSQPTKHRHLYSWNQFNHFSSHRKFTGIISVLKRIFISSPYFFLVYDSNHFCQEFSLDFLWQFFDNFLHSHWTDKNFRFHRESKWEINITSILTYSMLSEPILNICFFFLLLNKLSRQAKLSLSVLLFYPWKRWMNAF